MRRWQRFAKIRDAREMKTLSEQGHNADWNAEIVPSSWTCTATPQDRGRGCPSRSSVVK